MTSIQSALLELRETHHVDDALIESLQASRAQADTHIRFWARLMWTTNLTLIAVAGLLMGTGLVYMTAMGGGIGKILAGLALAIGALMTLKVLSVLNRQRETLRLLRATARRLWPAHEG